ncbi:3952_t:CDS:2, partial [Acaulospora colombiana]
CRDASNGRAVYSIRFQRRQAFTTALLIASSDKEPNRSKWTRKEACDEHSGTCGYENIQHKEAVFVVLEGVSQVHNEWMVNLANEETENPENVSYGARALSEERTTDFAKSTFAHTSEEHKMEQVSISIKINRLERWIKVGEGMNDVKAHPWFRGLDWDMLEAKELTPIFQPDQKKANFDATHELEELLLEDNPLKARKRNPNQDINTLSAEMRQMEEQFTPYDFKKMQRRSYYPHNQQQIMTSMTGTSSTGLVPSRPETPADSVNMSIGGRKTDDFSPMPAVPLGHMGRSEGSYGQR